MVPMPPFPSPAQDNLRAIVIRCGAVACFALMGGAFKWASEDGAGVFEMLFFRGLVGVPLLLGWLAIGGGVGQIRTRRPGAHLFRAVIGVGSLSLIYQALIRLPLADATTIGFSAPAFATIMSVLFLGEKVGIHRWTAVALGFVGVVIVTRPGGEALPLAGIVFALLGAVGNGAATVTIRQMGSHETPVAIAFSFLLFALLVGGLGMIWVATPHQPMTWAALLFGGVVGTAAQMMITRSLHLAPVSVVVPFDYLQILWAALLGWLIWSVLPGINTLIGALLIAASGLYTAWREHRRHRTSHEAVPIE
jgi:drug/metabolite transporter (DMT)-like permease